MPSRLRMSFFLALLGVPSCAIYDSALLEEAVGGDGDQGSGTGAASTGGSNPIGGSGGGNESGGSNMGGTGNCTEPTGQKGALTNVGETSLIEDFDRAWGKIGSGSPYTGQWFVARDMSGSGIDQVIHNQYEADPCAADGDTALHIVGSGYTAWGASIDATLMAATEEDPVDVSMYIGVTFWARSSDSDQIRIDFSDGDSGNGADPIRSAAPLFIESSWKQFWVEFPAGVSADQMTVIHMVAIADANFDFWIDDLTFYAAP